ncbi:MAG: cupin domain-containing protein [Desulfovibrionaceae bacterium]|nr:cupin domain-containing protein [Desulfovibrionaceae bacterium]
MIRRNKDVATTEACMFGGPGLLHAHKILEPDAFAGKGRLFNHCVLHPGEGIGEHPHNNEFEVYYILKGTGLYSDNGTETTVEAGDVTVCSSGEKHGLKNTGSEDLVFIALILFS